MSWVSRHTFLAFLLGAVLAALAMLIFHPAFAQMCKWVDETGCVHYAEVCPEGVQSQAVEIQKGPSEQEIAEAEARAEELHERAGAREDARRKEEAARAERRSTGALASVQSDLCGRSLRNAAVLNLQLPVYIDDTGQYHLRESLHNYYYQGNRDWLEDDQRAAELERQMQILESQCVDTDIDLHYVPPTYRDPPSGLETIRMLESLSAEAASSSGWFAEYGREWCSYSRYLLSLAHKDQITGRNVSQLEELIAEKCN